MRLLVVVTFLGFTSFALTLASLPSWAVSGGADAGAAGLVTTVMLAVTVLVQGFVPSLVARFGLSPVLVAGLLLLGAPAPLLIASRDLWWLLIISAVRGGGFAVITVLGADLTSRLAPPDRHGEAVGIYGLAIALPNLLAVPGGVALTSSHHFAVVAWLAAAPVLSVAFVGPLVRSLDAPREPATPTRASGLRPVIGPSFVLLVVTLAGGGLLTFLPIERPSGLLASATLLVFGAAGALSRWGAGLLADRIGTAVLLPASLVAASAGLVAVAAGLTTGLGDATVLVAAAVFGAGFGAVQNLTLILAFARAGALNSTTASAAWNAAFDAGTAIGALGVGAVAAAGPGLPWTYVGCAALMAVAIPLAVRITAARGVRARDVS
jgi:predicted MFS family arabinose efflux permease